MSTNDDPRTLLGDQSPELPPSGAVTRRLVDNRSDDRSEAAGHSPHTMS